MVFAGNDLVMANNYIIILKRFCVRDCSGNPFLRNEKKIAAESPTR